MLHYSVGIDVEGLEKDVVNFFKDSSLTDKVIFVGALAVGCALIPVLATYDVYKKAKPRVMYYGQPLADFGYMFR